MVGLDEWVNQVVNVVRGSFVAPQKIREFERASLRVVKLAVLIGLWISWLSASEYLFNQDPRP